MPPPMKPALYLTLLFAFAGCAQRSHQAAATHSSDCSFYQRAAERMKQPGGLASNVDPEVAWAWLSREAAQAGCAVRR